MERDPTYYNKLFQKIESGTASPEEIKEEEELMKRIDETTPLLLKEMLANMEDIPLLKHFILGTYCLYKVCAGRKCTDMLIDGIRKIGCILEESHK